MSTSTPLLDSSSRPTKVQMFALSFTALFLEMMVIRWVPSVVPLIAYYSNLMLLSSFLGLGVGALAAKSRTSVFKWFPAFLACEIVTLLLCRHVTLGASAVEARFNTFGPTVLNTLALLWIFAINALVFVPLGQRMGALFNTLPRLSAYGWDLAGSLSGTVGFGLFSLTHFSPQLGLAVVMVIYLALSPRGRWRLDLPVFAAVLVTMFLASDPAAIWSPYHYITVSRIETPNITEDAPPANLRTMINPPIYSASINQLFYHFDATFRPERYRPGSWRADSFVPSWARYYQAPYLLAERRDRVLILGAGGGGDVEAALVAGARHVDAVEIDPVVIQVARRFNAGAPYADPRVAVHVNDARAYLARAKPGYDVVAFGLLDSHALFTSMNNVRLDGHVYTVEAMREAYGLLADHGLLFLSFYAIKDWMVPKLYQMVAAGTGRTPTMYIGARTVILCVSKDPRAKLPRMIFQFERTDLGPVLPRIDVPTDDWPFLYLSRKAIPSDYLIAIGCLLALSLSAIAGLRRSALGAGDLHFGLLGMGFLLLETKSISDCSLYFGATWLVTVIVVSGVLLMVIAANFVAVRLREFSVWLYAPLFCALALLLLVPREGVLGLDFPARLLWAVLAVPLPVFFAGIIFSTTFRDAGAPSSAFGANLIGAMIGGFCEYLAMAIGSWRLSLLVAVAYGLSLLTLLRAKRSQRAL
ncbi:MAG TPA: hypothetical protein VG710_11590 [Opitutus sp.]|nr:hypothetical protein [Opitutus sp.]